MAESDGKDAGVGAKSPYSTRTECRASVNDVARSLPLIISFRVFHATASRSAAQFIGEECASLLDESAVRSVIEDELKAQG